MTKFSSLQEVIEGIKSGIVSPEEGLIYVKRFKEKQLASYRSDNLPLETEELIYYSSKWEPRPIGDFEKTQNKRNIVIFDRTPQLYRNFLAILREEYSESQLYWVKDGDMFDQIDSQEFGLNVRNPEHMDRLLELMSNERHTEWVWIVNWDWQDWETEMYEKENRLDEYILNLFHLTKAWMRSGKPQTLRIMCMYESESDVPNPFFTAVGGYARSVRKEFPSIIIQTCHIQDSKRRGWEQRIKLFQQILREFDGEADEVEIACSIHGRQVLTLHEVKDSPSVVINTVPPQKNGAVIITGGVGGIGFIVAQFLARTRKTSLVLAGRSEEDVRIADKLSHLRSLGSEVLYVQTDVTSPDEVDRLIERTKNNFGFVQGVIHGAGIAEDSVIINKTSAQFCRVLAAKVAGTVLLDRATWNEPLQYFVLFSSITGKLGNVGQADYAYANRFLDGYAQYRNQVGRSGHSISINWPLWTEGGMSVDSQMEEYIYKTSGIRAISADTGCRIFENALYLSQVEIMALAGNHSKIKSWLAAKKEEEQPERMPVQQIASYLSSTQPVGNKTDINAQTTDASLNLDQLRNELSIFAAAIIKIDRNELDDETSLAEYGFDSITFVELANQINDRFGIEMSPTVFYGSPTIHTIAQNITEEHGDTVQRNYYSAGESRSSSEFVQELQSGEGNISCTVPHEQSDLLNGALLDALEKDVKTIISEIIRLEFSEIEMDISLSEYGFDSITFVELANRINEKYTIELTPTVFYGSPTAYSIVQYLSDHHRGEIRNVYSCMAEERYQLHSDNLSPSEETEQPYMSPMENDVSRETEIPAMISEYEQQSTQAVDGATIPVAIIGASGAFPQSANVDELWGNLVAGRNLISEIPEDRWDWKAYFGDPRVEHNKTNIKWGGFMHEIDKFDPHFFGISGRDAEMMDPQERLVLEHVWKAIEDAGYRAKQLSGTSTGVFLGVCTADYKELQLQAGIPAAMCQWGLTNRISYMFNFSGPSEPIDTACSSSLVAIHRAVEAIRSGQCDMVLAGGVNVIASPNPYLMQSKAGMLSEDGSCKTFDERADGYVRGEGVGILLLKRLDQAKADGDHVYAVIRSSAVNHGGRASSFTAPNPNAQAEVLVKAYERAGIDPQTVSYIETHGTGTKLGDPIEIDALKKAFKTLYKKWNRPVPEIPNCRLGSLKTNLGHLEAAAGVAGVIKVMLAMKHCKLPGLVHFNSLNPYIQLTGSPFVLERDVSDWCSEVGNGGNPRRAGVSSFGIGGVNAHVVLEEYTEEAYFQEQGENAYIVVLSAKEEDRLCEYARLLANYVSSCERNCNSSVLKRLAYTMQLGREAFDHRVAFIVSDLMELHGKLTLFADGNTELDSVYKGCSKSGGVNLTQLIAGSEGSEFIRLLIQNRNLKKLSQLWVSGVDLDWGLFYDRQRPKRLSLPTYPFAKERYWIPKEADIVLHATNNEDEILRKADNPSTEESPLLLEKEIVHMMADTLKEPISRIRLDAEVAELGFDSISLTELTARINRKYGLELKIDLFFKYTPISRFISYLLEEYGGQITQHNQVFTSSPKSMDIDMDETSAGIVGNGNAEGDIPKLPGNLEILEMGPYSDKSFLLKWYQMRERGGIQLQSFNFIEEYMQPSRKRSPKMLHMLAKDSIEEQTEVIVIGKGKPLLLITGFALTAPQFIYQINEWSSQYQLIIIHLPGCGLSTGRHDLSVGGLSRRFVRVLERLGIQEPVHIITTSWGGLVGQKLAQENFQLVASLVLTGGFFHVKQDLDIKEKLQMDFERVGHGQAFEIIEKSHQINPSISKYFDFFNEEASTEEVLSDVLVPALIVSGDMDSIVSPEHAIALRKRLPHAEYHEIKGAGHAPFITHYKEFNRCISDFIARVQIEGEKKDGTQNI